MRTGDATILIEMSSPEGLGPSFGPSTAWTLPPRPAEPGAGGAARDSTVKANTIKALDVKSAIEQDIKPDMKPDIKPDAKPDATSVTKPDPRPDVRPAKAVASNVFDQSMEGAASPGQAGGSREEGAATTEEQ